MAAAGGRGAEEGGGGDDGAPAGKLEVLPPPPPPPPPSPPALGGRGDAAHGGTVGDEDAEASAGSGGSWANSFDTAFEKKEKAREAGGPGEAGTHRRTHRRRRAAGAAASGEGGGRQPKRDGDAEGGTSSPSTLACSFDTNATSSTATMTASLDDTASMPCRRGSRRSRRTSRDDAATVVSAPGETEEERLRRRRERHERRRERRERAEGEAPAPLPASGEDDDAQRHRHHRHHSHRRRGTHAEGGGDAQRDAERHRRRHRDGDHRKRHRRRDAPAADDEEREAGNAEGTHPSEANVGMGEMARRRASSFSLTRLRVAAEKAKERDGVPASLELRNELIATAAKLAGFPGIPVERKDGKVTFHTGLRMYERLFDETVRSVVDAAEEGSELRALAVRRAVAASEEALIAELGEDEVPLELTMALEAARPAALASAQRFRDEPTMERISRKALYAAVQAAGAFESS